MKQDANEKIVSLLEKLQQLPDPRNEKNRKHLLVDVMGVAVLAILSGAEGPTDIKLWATHNELFLQRFFKLQNGIPSRDCFRRVLGRVDPILFQKYFAEWLHEHFGAKMKASKGNNTISIDGKMIARSGEPLRDQLPTSIVSAWCSEHHLMLGQIPMEKKPDEIAATLELLDHIDIRDDTVTTDALGCQKNIAKKVIEKKGNYALAVKGNQKKLHDKITDYFNSAVGERTVDADVRQFVTEDHGHGRDEVRYHCVASLPSASAIRTNWTGAKAIGMVTRESVDGHGRVSEDTRYFLLSKFISGERFAHTVRAHWGIENSCHWVLDVVFNEDRHRSRDRKLATNLSLLKRFALSILKQYPYKASIKGKRKAAGWNTDFLLKILEFQVS